jgi:GT2 family glycosyltransferase
MNLAFRRDVVDQVGSYDPFFNVMAEIDLQVRIRKNGYRVDYEPAAILEHHYTGVNYKKRHARGGAQLVRLYFCMKHYRPKSFREWIAFLSCETSFFWKDLKRILQGFGSSVLHLKLQRWPELFKALFQAVSSRLAIPWLIWRANRDRAALAAE